MVRWFVCVVLGLNHGDNIRKWVCQGLKKSPMSGIFYIFLWLFAECPCCDFLMKSLPRKISIKTCSSTCYGGKFLLCFVLTTCPNCIQATNFRVNLHKCRKSLLFKMHVVPMIIQNQGGNAVACLCQWQLFIFPPKLHFCQYLLVEPEWRTNFTFLTIKSERSSEWSVMCNYIYLSRVNAI